MKLKLVRWSNDGNLLLGYAGDEWATPVVDDNPNCELKELADFCDHKAESRNNHAFVGLHRLLAAFLLSRCGRFVATVLMQEIAERGGLDGMNGLGTDEDGLESSFADFGIAECWAEWGLSAPTDGEVSPSELSFA